MPDVIGRHGALPVVAVRAAGREQQVAPPGVWFPAVAMAVALVVAATAGLTLGVLAALQQGVAGERWLATVQAHGELQLWGWFAVFIGALLFEFTVRLNNRPAIPLRSRAIVLVCFGGGALVSAVGRLFVYEGMQVLVVAGAASMVLGAVLLLLIVLGVKPARPYRVDLHPLFFRSGALWLLGASLAALVASRDVVLGATASGESQVAAELFLRGFVMNVTIAVALRAFVGHLDLPPTPVAKQRVAWVLLNGSVVAWVLGSPAFGLAGMASLVSVANLLFAAALLWITWALDIGGAIRHWGRRVQRPQVLVPIAWLGLVLYAIGLSVQAAVVLAGGAPPALFEAGATRHLLMLGFVAPLLIAMSHVVLERFLIGRLVAANWLTGAFVLLMVAWPMRVAPSLLDVGGWELRQELMATAGVLTVAALLVAAAATAQNAVVAERYGRQLRPSGAGRAEPAIARFDGARGRPQPITSTRLRELDVREDIAAGREPFARIMGAASEVGPEDALLLIVPFEPVPLYALLAAQGFEHEAEPHADGSWRVTFRRRSGWSPH